MRYVFELTVPADTPAIAPEELEVALTTGTLKQVEIAFKPGPAWMVKVIILDKMMQISPANPDSYHCWDDYTEVFSMNYRLSDPTPILTLIGWSPDTVFPHTITFRFDVDTKSGDEKMVLTEAMLSAPLIMGKGQ